MIHPRVASAIAFVVVSLVPAALTVSDAKARLKIQLGHVPYILFTAGIALFVALVVTPPFLQGLLGIEFTAIPIVLTAAMLAVDRPRHLIRPFLLAILLGGMRLT